ncbi:hypothetical protein C8R47DRAFT_1212738 [Mycena vitilis]|nr:hypothetical protein C8R47DRAFT_1212738 [Mycena vitilis]
MPPSDMLSDIRMDLAENPLTMKLMDRDAWKVRQAPFVYNGVDLAKNRPRLPELTGPLDGRAAACVEMGHTSYFITTNANYVPLPPEVDQTHIILRRDMRYGPDDPVLWPRLYSDKYCHLAAVPKAPTFRDPTKQEELGAMWWNPTPDHFVCPASGLTLTRGLGRLAGKWASRLAGLAKALIAEYEDYAKSLPAGTRPLLLLPQLAQRLQLSLERLRIPSTYVRMVIGVTTVQREYLELAGLLRYTIKYKPRLEGFNDPEANTALPDDCIGCFTADPRIAQIFFKACLPCWLIRPLKAFADEHISQMVIPFKLADFLEMKPAPEFKPVKATQLIDERLSLLHRCTQNMPWYQDPFDDGARASAPIASGSGSSRAGAAVAQSGTADSSRSQSSAPLKGKGSPYAAARRAQKEAKGPNPNAKQPRDKFLALDRPEMPTSIPAWATALAAIDRSRAPSCGDHRPQLYVMPEPALLASPDDEPRRRMLYHHYRLLRDALMFRLADTSVRPALLTTQQWRDIMQGKVTAQGKAGTRAQARSASLEELLRPAFTACGISETASEEFPVSPDAVPPLMVQSTKELLWELAEINFRYEFLALDARASGLQRPDECRRCFAGDALIGIDIRESQRGLAAPDSMDRLPYLLGMARLMRDWRVPCDKPHGITGTQTRMDWDPPLVRLLEQAVARYYVQSFYELFGRAAVVPMRLNHQV